MTPELQHIAAEPDRNGYVWCKRCGFMLAPRRTEKACRVVKVELRNQPTGTGAGNDD